MYKIKTMMTGHENSGLFYLLSLEPFDLLKFFSGPLNSERSKSPVYLFDLHSRSPEEDICYSQNTTLCVKKKSGKLTGDPETVIVYVDNCVSPQTYTEMDI